jgi:hypothetical protein
MIFIINGRKLEVIKNMLKKITLLMFFFFGFVVLSISIWRMNLVSAKTVIEASSAAQEKATLFNFENELVTASDYALPYPGLLPDHPLYFIKMIRDRIQLWFTVNAEAKTKLLLHYADKRIASALVLAENGKNGLAVNTAMKASLYFDRAYKQSLSVADEAAVNELQSTLVNALIKHKQVFQGINARVTDEAEGGMIDVSNVYSNIGNQLAGDTKAEEAKPAENEESGNDGKEVNKADSDQGSQEKTKGDDSSDSENIDVIGE